MIDLRIKVTSAGIVVNGKRNLRALMRKAGNEVAQAARRKIGGGKGPSLPGQSPNAKNKGHDPKYSLKRSIKVYPFKDGEGVAIRARAFYSVMLEGGAKGGGNVSDAKYRMKLFRSGRRYQTKSTKARSTRILLPRPFLTTALAERTGSLGERIRDAIVNDIAFRKSK